jgi:hypothetical protein
MWLCTTIGFITAVKDDTHPTRLIVRCRREDDMERFRKFAPTLTKTVFHGDFDYPYRAYIEPAEFGDAMKAVIIHEVDYRRFKPAIRDRLGDAIANVYNRAWAVFTALEADPKRIDAYYNKNMGGKRTRKPVGPTFDVETKKDGTTYTFTVSDKCNTAEEVRLYIEANWPGEDVVSIIERKPKNGKKGKKK